jgi:hypothetical protein
LVRPDLFNHVTAHFASRGDCSQAPERQTSTSHADLLAWDIRAILPGSAGSYPWCMNWHDVFNAAYQIPLCFSAALLIGSIGKALLHVFAEWLTGN